MALRDPRLQTAAQAEKVATDYGIALPALARAVGHPESALHKVPLAPGIKQDLTILRSLWLSMRNVIATDEDVRAWLRERLPEGYRPIDILVKEHDLAKFVDFIERITLGLYA